jgi:copper(I)-binding protein
MTMDQHIAAPVAPIDTAPAPNAFAIGGAWARPTAMAGEGDMHMSDGEVSAAYMTVLNLGESDCKTLIAAETSAAAAAKPTKSS